MGRALKRDCKSNWANIMGALKWLINSAWICVVDYVIWDTAAASDLLSAVVWISIRRIPWRPVPWARAGAACPSGSLAASPRTWRQQPVCEGQMHYLAQGGRLDIRFSHKFKMNEKVCLFSLLYSGKSSDVCSHWCKISKIQAASSYLL